MTANDAQNSTVLFSGNNSLWNWKAVVIKEISSIKNVLIIVYQLLLSPQQSWTLVLTSYIFSGSTFFFLSIINKTSRHKKTKRRKNILRARETSAAKREDDKRSVELKIMPSTCRLFAVSDAQSSCSFMDCFYRSSPETSMTRIAFCHFYDLRVNFNCLKTY